MLLAGDYSAMLEAANIFRMKEEPFVIYNMSSPYVRIDTDPYLFYGSLNSPDTYEFDIEYANYIQSNKDIFLHFFMIPYNLYKGNHVLIMIGINDYKISLLESLFKFIQQMYGYNGFRFTINDIYLDVLDDPYYRELSSFTIQGLSKLDADKEALSEDIYNLEGWSVNGRR